jgi:GDP-4-dehydro-6-deoxy-D-mannose reductase
MELTPFDSIFDGRKFDALKKSGHMIDIESLGPYEAGLKGARSASPDPSFWAGKRVLVTGASGMVGSTMIDILSGLGATVYGTIKRHAVAYHPNIQHNLENGKLKAVEVDLRDYGRVVSIMKEIEPHAIFHQAAESFVPTSIQQPSHVVENNCVSTVNVLEAATKDDSSLEGVQLACSSEQYGFVKNASELPIKEESEMRPTSTYAVTKVFTDYIARAYYYMYKTPTVITRTFNQEGPRRGPQFFTARIGMQVASCLGGKTDRVVMGNPNSVRDFLHIHDSARAQILAVEKCERGEVYNICSGKGISTGDYARLALRTMGLEGKVPLMIDRSLLRSYERGEALIDGFIGDNSKFVKKTGWSPTKSVVDIIRDGVEYYKSVRGP